MMRLTVIVAAALAWGCQSKPVPADLLIKGGPIYTADDQSPTAEAVVVSADTIRFVGALEEALKFQGESTQVIDLQGATMTPGFIESHGHIMGVGYNEMNLDLMSVKSYEELVEKVKEAVAKAEPGQWILGRGWHQDKWDTKPAKMVKGFQTHELLSAASPDNPVYLSHASGHAGFANAKAMQLAGVNLLSVEKLSGELEGGEILRDKNGNPTGIFNERAQGLIRKVIPENTTESNTRALTLAMDACARHGLTGFHDAGASRENIELFQAFADSGKLKTRLYVMITGWDRELIRDWYRRGPLVDPRGVTVRAIKLNCDGALGSRGAWLLEPYSDRTDFSGMATFPMDSVLSTSRDALKFGFQVCSHAIGDRANQEVLDRYETAFKENPSATDHRFRIEHAQHLHPNDIPRFGQMGVIPAMQAIHLSSDRPWAIERLGEKRIKEGAYMWQSLLKSGAKVINGTDAPVEPLTPIASFYASVSRKTLKGEPDGGYEPEEKMTRAQALRSYTLDAAYGAFEEKIKGSITVGKLADFTVFSQDIMTVDERSILKTEVIMTLLGGEVVYKRKDLE
jgi:predicted amidohydrolase YtcJ